MSYYEQKIAALEARLAEMNDKPRFDMNPFFWGITIALLYLVAQRLKQIVELMGGQP